ENDRCRIDRCRNDTSFEFYDLFDKGRKTLQDQIEHTTRFTGLDHVRVKAVKDLRVPLERLKECRTFFDVGADLTQNILKERILLLFGENVETLNERQTGIDHNGELPRENGEFLRFDLFAASKFGDRDLAAFFRGLSHNDL